MVGDNEQTGQPRLVLQVEQFPVRRVATAGTAYRPAGSAVRLAGYNARPRGDAKAKSAFLRGSLTEYLA
jgi:hypothetical protein